MGFEKVRFGKDLIFQTLVEDVDGRELAKWKVMRNDYPKVVRILLKQFGFKEKVTKRNQEEEDLNWALK